MRRALALVLAACLASVAACAMASPAASDDGLAFALHLAVNWAICAFVFTHNMLAMVDRSVRVMHPARLGYESSVASAQCFW